MRRALPRRRRSICARRLCTRRSIGPIALGLTRNRPRLQNRRSNGRDRGAGRRPAAWRNRRWPRLANARAARPPTSRSNRAPIPGRLRHARGRWSRRESQRVVVGCRDPYPRCEGAESRFCGAPESRSRRRAGGRMRAPQRRFLHPCDARSSRSSRSSSQLRSTGGLPPAAAIRVGSARRSLAPWSINGGAEADAVMVGAANRDRR